MFWVSGNRLMERMKAGLVSQALRVRRDSYLSRRGAPWVEKSIESSNLLLQRVLVVLVYG